MRSLFAALAVTGLMTSHAFGLTITNRDASSHSVTIKKGEVEKQLTISEGGSVEEACEEGCVLRLAGASDELDAKNTDKFVIEGNKFVMEDDASDAEDE